MDNKQHEDAHEREFVIRLTPAEMAEVEEECKARGIDHVQLTHEALTRSRVSGAGLSWKALFENFRDTQKFY